MLSVIYAECHGTHDIQHNDAQHNDTQCKGLICDIQYKRQLAKTTL
jgi:hypothetical protein